MVGDTVYFEVDEEEGAISLFGATDGGPAPPVVFDGDIAGFANQEEARQALRAGFQQGVASWLRATEAWYHSQGLPRAVAQWTEAGPGSQGICVVRPVGELVPITVAEILPPDDTVGWVDGLVYLAAGRQLPLPLDEHGVGRLSAPEGSARTVSRAYPEASLNLVVRRKGHYEIHRGEVVASDVDPIFADHDEADDLLDRNLDDIAPLLERTDLSEPVRRQLERWLDLAEQRAGRRHDERQQLDDQLNAAMNAVKRLPPP
jgi:hypothetical protein